jgi:hypothetical protein
VKNFVLGFLAALTIANVHAGQQVEHRTWFAYEAERDAFAEVNKMNEAAIAKYHRLLSDAATMRRLEGHHLLYDFKAQEFYEDVAAADTAAVTSHK